MILVTGAGGKTGQAIVPVLAAAGLQVRALVHRAEQRERLRRLGAAEVVIGDLRVPETWTGALAGIDAVYHICPNLASDELAIGRLAIDAARAAGVAHLVYHSVLHPQTEAMPHHWNKLRVEEALLESGLPCTVLQPAPYMQNLLAGWEAIRRDGRYSIPYSVDTRLSLVDLIDVAEVAAAVLTQPDHQGASYELCGTGPLTQVEIAAALTRALDRPVRAETVELDAWEQQARIAGLGEYQIQTLLRMFGYYQAHGLGGSPRVLSWLLGRPPTSVESFAGRFRD